MARHPFNSCLLVSSSDALSYSTFFRNYYIFGGNEKGFVVQQDRARKKKIKLLWFSCINLASEHNQSWLTDCRFRYILFVFSPGAKHLLVGCTHSAWKCIIARLVKLRYLICVVAVIVIHLWNGNQRFSALRVVSLYFLRHRKMDKAPLTFLKHLALSRAANYTQ